MATRAKRTKKLKLDPDFIRDFTDRLEEMACCGLQEVYSLYQINTKGKALALRGAAYIGSNYYGQDPEDYHKAGYALATTTQQQGVAAKNLKAAGWKALAKFTNPRTNNKITLWGAPTIKVDLEENHVD